MAMTTPNVPVQDPGQTELLMGTQSSPWDMAWWTQQTITNISGFDASYGWLLSQGWSVVGAPTMDNTTVPPTPYYTMSRYGLNNWAVLQSLLSEYAWAYNSALEANSIRYNDVVRAWENMIGSSHIQWDAQVTERNTQATLFLGNLDTYMDEVDSLIEANQSQIVLDAAKADAALTEAEAKLDDLETNLVSTMAAIEALLTSQDGNLSTFLTNFANELGELDTNYTAHLAIVNPLLSSLDSTLSSFTSDAGAMLTTILADYTTLDGEINALLVTDASTLNTHASDYNAVLALLESDYDSHASLARDFLTDLGTTETARIAEKFAASLSAQMQQLVDRGLYSSALAIDVTARNARDHNEEIVALNDRLMREKLANQHQLYSQQVQMRGATMAGKDHMYALKQELSRYHAAQITGLYGLLQSVRDRTLAVKQTILTVQQAVTQFTVGIRNELLAIVNGIVGQQAAGIDRQYTAKQDVSRVAMSEQERMFGMIQDATKGVIAGKDRYAAAVMQLASTLAEHKHRAIVEKMNEFNTRLAGLQGQHDQDMKLMAYQLDERNKLLIGIYGFVERREDVGPKFEAMAQVCTALGDSGGGWLTP